MKRKNGQQKGIGRELKRKQRKGNAKEEKRKENQMFRK